MHSNKDFLEQAEKPTVQGVSNPGKPYKKQRKKYKYVLMHL